MKGVLNSILDAGYGVIAGVALYNVLRFLEIGNEPIQVVFAGAVTMIVAGVLQSNRDCQN